MLIALPEVYQQHFGEQQLITILGYIGSID